MGGLAHRLRGLCLPPLLFCTVDAALTLAGQSPAYWSGDYAQENESSPTFNHLLQVHPAGFAAGILAWATVFVGIIVLLPETAALMMSIAVTLGHTAGAATWLLWRFQYGYQACNALFLASAVVLALGIRYGWRASPEHNYQFRGWSLGLRWLAATGLFCVCVYLFLWPRTP